MTVDVGIGLRNLTRGDMPRIYENTFNKTRSTIYNADISKRSRRAVWLRLNSQLWLQWHTKKT